MLLIDKYHIKNKEDIIFNEDIYIKLFNNKYNDLPNLLINGPPGCGKHTLINLLLKDIYGEDNMRIQTKTIVEFAYNPNPAFAKEFNSIPICSNANESTSPVNVSPVGQSINVL